MNMRFMSMSLGCLIVALPSPAVAQPREVELRAPLTSTVDSIHVTAGSVVKKGDVLIQLDSRLQTAELEAAKARLAGAEAALARAEADHRRADKLFKNNAISREDFDTIVAKQAQAQSAVVERRADLQKYMIVLDITRVRAPFDGTVDRPRVNVGATVKANETIVITITATQAQKPLDDVRQLQKERHAILVKIVEETTQHFKSGRGTIRAVVAASRAANEAALELADTPAKRIEILREEVELARQMQKMTAARHQAGVITSAEFLEAQANTLEARIRLAREEAQNKAKSK